MRHLGFPPEFIKWTKLGFKSTQASLIINDKLTTPFDLPGGGRQGDNLFPLIFAIVAQGLASLISTSSAVGIKVGESTHKIWQYADDSTLLIGDDGDWGIYKICIEIFCDASGMVINWDKSQGLWLGAWNTSPPKIKPPTCPLELKFILDKDPVRMLGAYLGTHIPIENAWNRTKQKLQTSLSSVMKHCGDEIGDTITVNAILISSAIFTIRLQYIPRSKLREINKMATNFIRGKKYMVRDSQRYTSKEHGAVVPLIDIANLATTLQANWFYRILNPDKFHTSSLLFEPYWLAEISRITQQHKFKCLDHMIMSDVEWLNVKPTDVKNIAPFTHQCVLSFCAMRFTREITLNFESIMNQPIFHNPNLINPNTLESWKHQQLTSKIYRLSDLFIDFNIHAYRQNTYVPNLENPIWNSGALSHHFSTPKSPCIVSQQTWEELIVSIPQDWMNMITRGNQFFHNNEFFSTIPPIKDALGTIYQYLEGGLIQQFVTSHKGIITPIGFPVLPNSISNTGLTHPPLHHLKRVTVYTTQPPLYEKDIHQLNFHLTTYTLPYYPKSTPLAYNNNVLRGIYTHVTHPDLPFKSLKKIWRLSPPFTICHPRTQEFIDQLTHLGIRLDVKLGLKDVMNSIQQADVSPLKRLMLTRLINKSLYIGQPAHEYQTVTKHVDPNDRCKITPQHCIYHLYSRPHEVPIPATYQYLLWDSPQAKFVWNLTRQLITQLGTNLEITSPYQIPLIFLPNIQDTPSLIKSTIQHVIVASLWVIYKGELDLKLLHQTNKITPDTIKYWMAHYLRKEWVHEMTEEIQHLPHTVIYLKTLETQPNAQGEPIRRYTYRQSALFHREYTNFKKISLTQIAFYQQFWTATALIEIVDSQLVFTPYHLYPP